MKKLLLITVCFFICITVFSKNHLTGIVRSEKGLPLQRVAVQASSTDQLEYTDKDGKFDVPLKTTFDSVSFFLEGYQTIKLYLSASSFHQIVLQKLNLPEKHLVSYIKRRHDDESIVAYGGETYSSLVENPIVYTNQTDSVSFNINTNLASYSNVRRFIDMNDHVPPDAVRIWKIR